METQNEIKKRHGCVTAWLVMMIIANALTSVFYLFVYLVGSMVKQDPETKLTTPLISLLVIIGIANVFFSVLLLKWNKIGFYGFLMSSIGALIVNIYIGLGIGQSSIGLIGFAILYAVLQIKRDDVSAWENLE
ncbi:MAG: hypothetical protein V4677_05405 [Bacteroidota bacterium]